MKFLSLCCLSVFLFALFVPTWGEREFMGIVNCMWFNGDEILGPFAMFRVEHSLMFTLVSAVPHFEPIVSFELIDFTAQINNLAYLNVVNQNITIILAFNGITAVHNIFICLCPSSADQTDDILIVEVVLQLGDGTLTTVGKPASIDIHPLHNTYNRYVLHSRQYKKLPIAIFDTREFNIRVMKESLFVILAIRPDDGEGEIFYYGLAFASLGQLNKLVSEAVNHGVTDIYIPRELDERLIVHFAREIVMPLFRTQTNANNVKRGNWLIAEFIP